MQRAINNSACCNKCRVSPEETWLGPRINFGIGDDQLADKSVTVAFYRSSNDASWMIMALHASPIAQQCSALQHCGFAGCPR
jgi:hypothetical protein